MSFQDVVLQFGYELPKKNTEMFTTQSEQFPPTKFNKTGENPPQFLKKTQLRWVSGSGISVFTSFHRQNFVPSQKCRMVGIVTNF